VAGALQKLALLVLAHLLAPLLDDVAQTSFLVGSNSRRVQLPESRGKLLDSLGNSPITRVGKGAPARSIPHRSVRIGRAWVVARGTEVNRVSARTSRCRRVQGAQPGTHEQPSSGWNGFVTRSSVVHGLDFFAVVT
jgi:hypothetical protein